MNSARTALRERVAALAQARRALAAGRLEDAERILQDELSRWPANRDAQSLLAEVRRHRGLAGPDGMSVHVSQPTARPRPSGADAWSTFEARVRERKAAKLAERARAALGAGDNATALAVADELQAIAPDHPVLVDVHPPSGQPPPRLVGPPATIAPSPTEPAFRVLTEPLSLSPAEPASPSPPAEPASLPVEQVPVESGAGDLVIHRPAFAQLEETEPLPPRIATTSSVGERITRTVGLLLVAGSLLALSGWAGYRWFAPTEDARRVALQQATPPPARDAEPHARSSGGDEQAPTGTGGQSPSSAAPLPAPAPEQVAPTQAPTPHAEAVPPHASTSSAPTPVDVPPTTAPVPERREVEPPANQSTPVEAQAAPAAPITPPPTLPPATESAAAPPRDMPSTARDSGQPAEAPRTGDPPAPADATSAGPNAPDDTPPADAAAMRALIEGYLAGYNNLDAGGVHSVWPAVDRRALARAFGQLASQRLVFSRCEVRATADEGRAFCLGKATWRPRVGAGERTERRVWRFEFGQRAGQWAIDGVDIER